MFYDIDCANDNSTGHEFILRFQQNLGRKKKKKNTSPIPLVRQTHCESTCSSLDLIIIISSQDLQHRLAFASTFGRTVLVDALPITIYSLFA